MYSWLKNNWLSRLIRFLFSKEHRLLTLIVLIAFIPRFLGINFGLPNFHFHTDEPLIVNPIIKYLRTFNFKPDSYIYPSFNQYLQFILLLPFEISIRIWELIAYKLNNELYQNDIYILARFNVALISTATVILIYKLSAAIFGTNKKSQLLSAAIYAATFMSIFLSHYVKHETLLTFLSSLTLIFVYQYINDPVTKTNNLKLGSLIAGLSLMTHYNGFLFLFPLLLVIFIKNKTVSTVARGLTIACLFYVLGVFIGSPYTFLDYQKAIPQIIGTYTDLKIYAVFMSNQDGIPNALWYLLYLATSGLWYPIFFASAAGLVKGVVARGRQHLMAISYIIFFILFFSYGPQRTDRYLLPLIPLFAVYSGYFLFNLLDYAAKKLNNNFLAVRIINLVVIFVFILLPYLRGFLFSSIIASQDTREKAANYIFRKIPKNKFIFAAGDTIHIGQYLQGKSYPNIINAYPLDENKFFYFPGEIVVVDSVNYHVAQNYNNKVPEYTAFLKNYLIVKNQAKLIKIFSNDYFRNELFSPAFLEHSSTVNAYHDPTVEIYEIPLIKNIYESDYLYEYLPEKIETNMPLVANNGQKMRWADGANNYRTAGPYDFFPKGKYQIKIYYHKPICGRLTKPLSLLITNTSASQNYVNSVFACTSLINKDYLESDFLLSQPEALHIALSINKRTSLFLEKMVITRKFQ